MGTSPNESVPAARPGTLLGGKYRVERELARGGMGIVVIATHLKLDRPVAIKLLGLTGKDPSLVAARFLREARAAARLRGDHVVRIIDLDETADGTPYLVMELLEGVDLEHILSAQGKVAAAQAVNWGLQACAALAEAHARGVVHRDVKPSNLFRVERLDGPELIKLLDFGISKMVDDDVQLTRTATVLGSPLFMSPEQLLNPRSVDRRSDIWSLGVTLYRLLSNRAPFDAADASSMAAQIAARPAAPLHEVVAELPAALCAVVMRCLEKDPELRWPSVVALAEALDPFRAAQGLGSAAQVRLSEAQAVASLAAAPVTAPPPPVATQNFTLSHDVPRPAAKLYGATSEMINPGVRPFAPAPAADPLAPLAPLPVSVVAPPARRSAITPALIVAGLIATVGALIVFLWPAAPVVVAPARLEPAARSEPIAAVQVAPAPAEPVRADAGAARVRPARPHAAEAKDPNEMEIK